MSTSYKIPKLATEVDGNWVTAFSPDNLQNVIILSPSADRTTPLGVPGFPSHVKYHFEMVFPEQVSVSIDPREYTVTNKYFSATVTDYFRGNVARKSIDLKTLRAAVEASDYPSYAEDFHSLNKAIGGAFSVNKAFLDSADGSAKADLTRRLQDQRLEVIKKTTKTIDDGKLAGADLANVYCFRGSAEADLGREEEALQDANNAVRIAQNATSLSCRAGITGSATSKRALPITPMRSHWGLLPTASCIGDAGFQGCMRVGSTRRMRISPRRSNSATRRPGSTAKCGFSQSPAACIGRFHKPS